MLPLPQPLEAGSPFGGSEVEILTWQDAARLVGRRASMKLIVVVSQRAAPALAARMELERYDSPQ